MLEKQLKVIYPTINSGVATAVVNMANNAFKQYCNVDVVPEGASGTVLRLASYFYSRIGNDGLQSVSVSGISETLLTDYPDDIKRELNRYRRAVFL